MIIIPGDSLASHVSAQEAVTIGPGVYKYPKTQQIIPSSAGLLREAALQKKNDTLIYIDSNSKRYIPQVNDYVLGVVTGVFSDFFRVSLQEFSAPVSLSMMAFPNATKKNRPNLKVGQAVYARVSEAVPEVQTEIECVDPETGKDGGFGAMDEHGYVFDVNMNFARELLYNKASVFLETLAARIAFEIAIGINGKVWIKCGTAPAPAADEPPVEPEFSFRDMKLTLAAARYLVACQSVPAAAADEQLKLAFKTALA